MIYKCIGVTLIIAACGGFGWMIAAAYRKEIATLRQMISSLDYMECELQYNMTPLPQLCRQTAAESKSVVRTLFYKLCLELENQMAPNVEQCVKAVLMDTKDVPRETANIFTLLGSTLGRFDAAGQLRGLEAARKEARRKLDAISKNQTERTRSYKTLALCAGAAVAILLI